MISESWDTARPINNTGLLEEMNFPLWNSRFIPTINREKLPSIISCKDRKNSFRIVSGRSKYGERRVEVLILLFSTKSVIFPQESEGFPMKDKCALEFSWPAPKYITVPKKHCLFVPDCWIQKGEIFLIYHTKISAEFWDDFISEKKNNITFGK